MDLRALSLAAVIGVPPGVGMGLALLSVTRGEAVLASIAIGTVAPVILTGLIYLLTTRGTVEDEELGDQSP